MRRKYEILTSQKKNLFFPENYPSSVKSTYLGYFKYNLLLQCSSSALGVLSTQQLLLALGADSLTASAALNWVLKDGIGQLGGILYAGSTGNRFDENPKFYKWISATSLNISCAIEIISPLFPGYFLFLASIATIGKNISFISGSASRAAIHLNFSNENNLADLTAKSSTQTTASCLAGTVIGTFCGYYSTSYLIGASFFLGFSLIHLLSCYKGLNYIELNTLNPQRLDILLKEYINTGQILNISQVSIREKIIVPYTHKELVIGMNKIFQDFDEHKGFIIAKEGKHVHLIYAEDVNACDMIYGYVEARAVCWSKKIKGFEIKKLEDCGWDIKRPFLSPNNTRYKLIHSDI